MRADSRIYIAGHTGLVGSALLRKLQSLDYENLIYRRHSQLDLLNQSEVIKFFSEEQPEYVFLAAAKVGGILANKSYPAEFIYQNLTIQTQILHAAYISGVKRLLFLGSSCLYPKSSEQPIRESSLLGGPLEKTNEAYAMAKIAGIKMCDAYNRQYGTSFLAAMPTNLFGPHDNFDKETSHVIAALMRKFHEANISGGKAPVIWGSGKPRREFLYVDDLAEACIHLMKLPDADWSELILNNNYMPSINVGVGKDISVHELVDMMAGITGYHGEIIWDREKPDGVKSKLLDISRISRLGWRPRIPLKEGLHRTYQWYLKHLSPNL